MDLKVAMSHVDQGIWRGSSAVQKQSCGRRSGEQYTGSLSIFVNANHRF